MVLAPMAGSELAALTAHPEGYIAPWMYPANILLALSLVLLLLPGTNRYLKARHPS
jgi:hypothetical protein